MTTILNVTPLNYTLPHAPRVANCELCGKVHLSGGTEVKHEKHSNSLYQIENSNRVYTEGELE
jgi:hypothetical protein